MFYLFHHIPKTAGSSARRALSGLLDVVEDYQEGATPEQLEAYGRTRTNLHELRENHVLCGHYNMPGHRLWERYPELASHDVRKLVIFRDPLEAAKSGVRYNIERGWAKAEDADSLLTNRVGYFSGVMGCGEADFREAVDAYWLVGITERLQDFFDCLSVALDKPRVVVARSNTTSLTTASFSDDAIRNFVSANAVDQAIYEYAREKALESIAAMTASPGKEPDSSVK